MGMGMGMSMGMTMNRDTDMETDMDMDIFERKIFVIGYRTVPILGSSQNRLKNIEYFY